MYPFYLPQEYIYIITTLTGPGINTLSVEFIVLKPPLVGIPRIVHHFTGAVPFAGFQVAGVGSLVAKVGESRHFVTLSLLVSVCRERLRGDGEPIGVS